MEDNRKAQERILQRCYDTGRLEESVWTAAYEQIWPVLRRSLQRPSTHSPQRRQRRAAATPLARRA